MTPPPPLRAAIEETIIRTEMMLARYAEARTRAAVLRRQTEVLLQRADALLRAQYQRRRP